MEEYSVVTYILAAIGTMALTGAVGLLIKHLTLDHLNLDRKLDSIEEKVDELLDKKD